MLGEPKYKLNDIVSFKITPYKADKEITCTGMVYIIDPYGTLDQNEEPSYDIMVENFDDTDEPMLVKHMRESQLF